MAADEVDPKAPTLAVATEAAGLAAMTLTKGAPLTPAPVAASGSMVGKCLAHFRIEKLLGKGGMGEVYLATDVTLDRQVALKLLRREVASDPEYRDRFVREARAQARL